MQYLELSNQTKEIDLKSYKEIKIKCFEYEGDVPSYTAIYLNGRKITIPLLNSDRDYIINVSDAEPVGILKINSDKGKCKIQITTS